MTEAAYLEARRRRDLELAVGSAALRPRFSSRRFGDQGDRSYRAVWNTRYSAGYSIVNGTPYLREVSPRPWRTSHTNSSTCCKPTAAPTAASGVGPNSRRPQEASCPAPTSPTFARAG